jgi:hypothetical protein
VLNGEAHEVLRAQEVGWFVEVHVVYPDGVGLDDEVVVGDPDGIPQVVPVLLVELGLFGVGDDVVVGPSSVLVC